MDILTIIGLLLAAAAIVGGQVLEGGHISSILQPTAALIVFGGTLGAVFVHYSFRIVTDSIILGARTFLVNRHDLTDIIPDITKFARYAQREGILALENSIKSVDDPFFKKGLQLVIDGTGLNELKDILEIEIDLAEERRISAAKVFESAGGYAPTIGILGAVLGLIQVMQNLADPSMLGEGIAVAFVATVYGVASANLIWLPIAGKIKLRTRENTIQKEMILEGLVAMLSGESPRLIEDRLEGFVSRSQWKEGERATMPRRSRIKEETENHERWFVSYADFITLLFAFFTVMYALSTVNEQKYKAMSDSLSSAFSDEETVQVTEDEVVKVPVYKEDPTLGYMTSEFKKTFSGDYRAVQSNLSKLEASKKININIERRGVVVSLLEQGVFSSGEATLLPAALAVIDEIALTLKELPNQIKIEGHTDNIPIHNDEFNSNWELSSARAMNILLYMVERHSLDPTKLSATGYGEFRSITENNTPEGRAKNRRIDIVLFNRDAAFIEPM